MAVLMKVGATVPGVEASEDLTGHQYRFVMASGEKFVGPAAEGGPAVGVLQNKPAEGQAATVWGAGSTCKVVADAAVAAGSEVAVGANSGAKVAGVDDTIQGIALTGATDAGQFITLQR